MAEVLVVGKKISEMELITDISGDEKIPTGAVGDKAVTTGQLVEYLNDNGRSVWGRIDGDLNQQTDLQNEFISRDIEFQKHVTDLENPHQVTKSQLGLGNVDNTADVDKPISNLVKSELNSLYENGAALPYREGITYEENAVVVKDGKLQQWKGGEWVDINDNHNDLVGRDAAGSHPASAIRDAGGENQQTLNDFFKVAVYAEQYGIYPNHPTDQTALIDAAIADTASKGIQLKFSGGTYIIDPLRLPATYPWSSTFGLNIYTGMNILGEGAIFKIKDGSSTLAAPKWYTMFFTDTYKKDWSIQGIIFDGNAENNKKGNATTYNQAFIGVFNNEGYCDNVVVKRNIFRNNPGLNNVITGVSYFASQGQGIMKLGKHWDISENWHIDCGIESFDFTAVFGMGDFIKCDNNFFYNTLSQTGVSAPGPRNAYEVHGSYNTFNNNFIKSYYNGMIVNSNYNTPCVDIQVNNNIMVDMYQGGVRLWRTKSTAVTETPIKNVQIKGNQIHINGQLFGTNDTYKGGIWGTGYFNLGIDNVEIEDNTVSVDSYVRNKIAGVLLVPDEITVTGSTQVMSNYKIRNNKFYGTYNGVRIKVGNNCPSFKGLIVEDNEHIDPQLVALIYSDYQSYTFETTGNGQITDLIYRRNKSVGAKNGVVFSGNVYDITEQDNIYRGASVARLTSDLVSTAIFRGDGSASQANLVSTQTIRGWNLLQRKAFKVRVDYTKFTSNQFQTLITIPPKARIADIIADVVTPFNSDVTPTLRIGTANGGNQYLLLTPVDAAKQIGNANAELGAMLSGGKNGQFANWTAFSPVVATLSYTGTLTAGVIDFYIVVEYL